MSASESNNNNINSTNYNGNNSENGSRNSGCENNDSNNKNNNNNNSKNAPDLVESVSEEDEDANEEEGERRPNESSHMGERERRRMGGKAAHTTKSLRLVFERCHSPARGRGEGGGFSVGGGGVSGSGGGECLTESLAINLEYRLRGTTSTSAAYTEESSSSSESSLSLPQFDISSGDDIGRRDSPKRRTGHQEGEQEGEAVLLRARVMGQRHWGVLKSRILQTKPDFNPSCQPQTNPTDTTFGRVKPSATIVPTRARSGASKPEKQDIDVTNPWNSLDASKDSSIHPYVFIVPKSDSQLPQLPSANQRQLHIDNNTTVLEQTNEELCNILPAATAAPEESNPEYVNKPDAELESSGCGASEEVNQSKPGVLLKPENISITAAGDILTTECSRNAGEIVEPGYSGKVDDVITSEILSTKSRGFYYNCGTNDDTAEPGEPEETKSKHTKAILSAKPRAVIFCTSGNNSDDDDHDIVDKIAKEEAPVRDATEPGEPENTKANKLKTTASAKPRTVTLCTAANDSDHDDDDDKDKLVAEVLISPRDDAMPGKPERLLDRKGSDPVKPPVKTRTVKFCTGGGEDEDDSDDSNAGKEGNGGVGGGDEGEGGGWMSAGDRIRAKLGGRAGRRASKVPNLSAEELKRACLYVKDCVEGREENFKTDMKSMRAYEIYNHVVLRLVMMFSTWGLLLLTVFEDPAIPIVALPYYITMSMESFFLLIFLVRVLHCSYFNEPGVFRKNRRNIVLLVVISVTFVDMMSYIAWVHAASETGAAWAFRWSRPLRTVFLFLFPEQRRLRRALFNIWKTLPDILHVLILWLSSIALFALMAYKLLGHRKLVYSNNDPYFTNYWDTYWDLYVLVTTANNPDVMMPAYDSGTWFALFFVVFEIVNLYIFLNIVLAVVYNNYRSHLRNEVKSSVYMQRRLLSKAFELLKVYEKGVWFVPWERWQSLLSSLYPKMGHTKINLLLYVLDDNGDDKIEKAEFLQLKDLLSFEIVDVRETRTLLEIHCGSIYDSTISQHLRLVVVHKYFSRAFDALIIVNAICIAYDMDNVEWAFLSIFTVEIFVKLYAFGAAKYFSIKSNLFDFTVIAAAWFVTIGQNLFHDPEVRESIVDFLLILRIVRVVRIGDSIKRFHIVLTTIAKIIPFIFTYGRVIVLVYFVYAIVGMEIFKGRVTYYGYANLTNETSACGNPLLNNTEFFIKRYCKNNFNNIAHTFVLLFDLMIVNQWHELSNGFIVTTSKWSRLYFISFHILCVVVLLNIFAAFILEIFFVEFQLSKDKVETRVEAKILELQTGEVRSHTAMLLMHNSREEGNEDENDDEDKEDGESEVGGATRSKLQRELSNQGPFQEVAGLRFKLQKKSNVRVECVLQQMFESEIEPSDDGSLLDGAPPVAYQPRRLTLSML